MIERFAPYEMQMLVWGCDVAGNVVDLVAIIAEQPAWHATPVGYPLWDDTAADLASQRICTGTSWERVPDWWALPHVRSA